MMLVKHYFIINRNNNYCSDQKILNYYFIKTVMSTHFIHITQNTIHIVRVYFAIRFFPAIQSFLLVDGFPSRERLGKCWAFNTTRDMYTCENTVPKSNKYELTIKDRQKYLLHHHSSEPSRLKVYTTVTPLDADYFPHQQQNLFIIENLPFHIYML